MRTVTVGFLWLLLALASLGSAPYQPLAAFADDGTPSELKAGEEAPKIEGKDLDGKSIKLSDFRGKVVLLDFWFTTCGPCLAAVPGHRARLERYKGKPFVIVGINCDEDREAARKVSAKEKMAWPSFADGAKGPIAKQWQIRSWPSMYLLDEKGVIRYGPDYLGRIRFQEGPDGKLVGFARLDDALEELLKLKSERK